jgi:K+-sensing histidine kinase KdpD
MQSRDYMIILLYLVVVFTVFIIFHSLSDNKNYGLLFCFGILIAFAMMLEIKLILTIHMSVVLFILFYIDGSANLFIFLPIKSYDSIGRILIYSTIMAAPILIAKVMNKMSNRLNKSDNVLQRTSR